jgi:hypothetical protein
MKTEDPYLLLEESLQGINLAIRALISEKAEPDSDGVVRPMGVSEERVLELIEENRPKRGRPPKKKDARKKPDPEAADDNPKAVVKGDGPGRKAGGSSTKVRKPHKQRSDAPPPKNPPKLPTEVEVGDEPVVVTEGQFNFHDELRGWAGSTPRGVQIVKMALAERTVKSVREIPAADGEDFLKRCQAISEELQ